MTFSMLGTKGTVSNRGLYHGRILEERLDCNSLRLLINYFIQESDQLTLH